MMEELFMSTINISIIASYVILGVILVRIILKKAPRIFTYVLWGVVLIRLIAPNISFESQIGLLPNNNRYIFTDRIYDQIPQINNEPMMDHRSQINTESIMNQYLMDSEVVEPKEEIPSISSVKVFTFIGSIIWIIGMLVIVIYNGLGFMKLKRQLKRAKFVTDNVYISNEIDSPFVMGVINPRIYIISNLSKLETEFILKHEKCHIKRFDHITRILSFIALTIHWFNPLVWIAFILSGRDMEVSCDEAVMREMDTDIRAEYSRSLLTLATGKRSALNTNLAFGEGDTKDRVKNVMKYKKPMLIVCVLATITVLIITVGFMSSSESQDVSLNIDENVDKSAESNLDEELGSSANDNIEQGNILYETDEALVGILKDWKYKDDLVEELRITSEVVTKMQDIVDKRVEENNRIRKESKEANKDKEILENNKLLNNELKDLLGDKYEILNQYANRWWKLKHYDYSNPKHMEKFLTTITYPENFSYKGYKYENNEIILRLNQTKEETWGRVLEGVAFQLYDYIPNLQNVEFVTSLPSEFITKKYDIKWYNYQMGGDREENTADNQGENYEVIYDYIWKEIYHTFSPLYDVDRIEVSNYEEREGASYFDVTMYYYNYNRDPDTVGYIAALKESGDKDYQQLYDAYLDELDGSFEFKAIVNGDGSISLYTDHDPSSGEEWAETSMSQYIVSVKLL